MTSMDSSYVAHTLKHAHTHTHARTHAHRHPDRPGKECGSSVMQVRLPRHVCFWGQNIGGQGSQRREKATLVDSAP